MTIALALAACSKGASDLPPTGPAQAIDAGATAGDAGTSAACGSAGGSAGPMADLDAGPPPDGGLSYSPGPAPRTDRQSSSWVPTGAAGCEGLIPSSVAPRLSWVVPSPLFDGEPAVDGEGNLAIAFEMPQFVTARAFFPADGRPGLLVENRLQKQVDLIGRSRGFYARGYSTSPWVDWIRKVRPDGSDEDYGVAADSLLYTWLSPDPRGGYAQSRIRTGLCGGKFLYMYELRWVDDALSPRTQWWPITTWDYGYNITDSVLVDGSGKALVLVSFNPPMSMPCFGDLSFNAWVGEDGKVSPLKTQPPTYKTSLCDTPQGGSYGLPIALDDGFAFYFPPSPDAPVSGWWARFRNGETTSEPPPAWLSGQGYKLQRLANGAYLGVQQDASSCVRTAEVIGPAGQVCATVMLDGSTDCNAWDRISPDGTLVLQEWSSHSLVWWPGLGRPR